MFGSSIIDIGIGVVFVFLLFSLIASAINEILMSYLNMRGKELLRGLQTLLSDGDVAKMLPSADGLVSKIYNHGHIFGLFQGDFDPVKRAGHLPSYIPPQNFAIALIDVVLDTDPNSPRQEAVVLCESLRKAAQKLASDPDHPELEKVGKPLLSIVDAAGSDLGKLKRGIEDWYNSAMDRVSGWYKNRTQWILFALGLALAVVLNADAVRIVRQLSKDSTLRQAVVAAAQSAKQPDQGTDHPLQSQISQVTDQVTTMENLGIPLGWAEPLRPRGVEWMQALAGWFLTAVAVSLGAPFWFDILNKIMVVRSTVKPREKSHEEESKDKK